MATLAWNQYTIFMNALRESRRNKAHIPEHDGIILDNLEYWLDQMTDEEKELAESEWWRGWPDEYDKRQAK